MGRESLKHTTASKEHYSGWNIDLRETRLKKVAKIILNEKRGKLLDVGRSSGEFSSQFVRQGFDVYGTDFVEEKVEKAKKQGIKAVLIDFDEKLPFDDEFFDIIFAGEVIEHVIDTGFLLQEFNRVLKGGGKLIITTPNLASFENRIRLLFGIYPAWVNYNVAPPNHIRNYTPAILKTQLYNNGFSVIKHFGNFVPFLPQMFVDDVKFPFISFTGTLFPGLSQCIIMVAVKK